MSEPWVLVSGGFHGRGGMDRANAALAGHLLRRGHAVHLVAHEVEADLAGHPRATVRLVPRPGRSFLLGEVLLNRAGRRVARRVTRDHPEARVVVNGGSCVWGDLNWAHCLHHAWPCCDRGAPVWFKVKNRLMKAWACWRERAALRAARLVVANSERTRQDVLRHLGLPEDRVRTVYLGGDPGWGEVTPAERRAARAWLGLGDERPVVAFVGALSHDNNKGLDVLLAAWRELCRDGGWDAELVVAGGGNGVGRWRRDVAAAGLEARVRLLGFTGRVREVLAASDLLVSPARYEAYGLNVHEAVTAGVPALVSGRAGVAERYPAELGEMVLPDPGDAGAVAGRLRGWRPRRDEWKGRFAALGAALRRQTWDGMAARIVGLATGAA